MRVPATILAAFSLSMPASGQVQPRCIASRQVVLAFGSGQGVQRVETWLTTDQGHSWAQAASQRLGDGGLSFATEQDGRYGFYLVLENEAGRSADAPGAGSAPHIEVIVDTAPPTLQIRHAAVSRRGETRTIDLRLTLIEENLVAGGLRLFYRARPDDAWTDGGPLLVPGRPEGAAEILVSWPTPPEIAECVDLMLVCTDRAGNISREEFSGVRIVRRALPTEKFATDGLDGAAKKSRSVEPPLKMPRQTVGELHSASVGSTVRAEQMRSLAAGFLAEGRFDLAAARYSDALAETPNDPQLLTEYGAALVRSNRLEDARQRFEAALSASPTNTAALEGLALVAMGQQRLPDARNRLKHALEIDADAGRVWLRYGDVEYRMGNRDAALAAWSKASRFAGDEQLQATARERLKSLQK